MKNLKEKLRKNGGFTLVEMLIVVAIIAILIAISIPMVGNALERSREATDAANERSFKAELLLCYMAGTTNGKELAADNKFETGKAYCYDAANGKIGTAATAYGQGTDAGAHKGSGSDHKNMFLWGYVTGDGEVKMAWGKTLDTAGIDSANNLTGPKLNGTADAPAVNT